MLLSESGKRKRVRMQPSRVDTSKKVFFSNSTGDKGCASHCSNLEKLHHQHLHQSQQTKLSTILRERILLTLVFVLVGSITPIEADKHHSLTTDNENIGELPRVSVKISTSMVETVTPAWLSPQKLITSNDYHQELTKLPPQSWSGEYFTSEHAPTTTITNSSLPDSYRNTLLDSTHTTRQQISTGLPSSGTNQIPASANYNHYHQYLNEQPYPSRVLALPSHLTTQQQQRFIGHTSSNLPTTTTKFPDVISVPPHFYMDGKILDNNHDDLFYHRSVSSSPSSSSSGLRHLPTLSIASSRSIGDNQWQPLIPSRHPQPQILVNNDLPTTHTSSVPIAVGLNQVAGSRQQMWQHLEPIDVASGLSGKSGGGGVDGEISRASSPEKNTFLIDNNTSQPSCQQRSETRQMLKSAKGFLTNGFASLEQYFSSGNVLKLASNLLFATIPLIPFIVPDFSSTTQRQHHSQGSRLASQPPGNSTIAAAAVPADGIEASGATGLDSSFSSRFSLQGRVDSVMGWIERSVEHLPSFPRLHPQECVKRSICEAHNEPTKYGAMGLMLRLLFPATNLSITDRMDNMEYKVINKYRHAAGFGLNKRIDNNGTGSLTACKEKYEDCLVSLLEVGQKLLDIFLK